MQPEERSTEDEARYRRLVISHFDFAEAAQFLNQFVALAGVPLTNGVEADELRRALTVASVIAYARPFTRNFGAPVTAASIQIEDVSDVTTWQRALHDRLMDKRSRIFAHSDAEMAALRYDRDHPTGPVPRVVDPRIAFTIADANNVHALAATLSIWCAGQATRLSGVPLMGSRRAAPSDIEPHDVL